MEVTKSALLFISASVALSPPPPPTFSPLLQLLRHATLSWKNSIQDDPLTPERPFKKGTISFAGAGPNTRSADLFISYSANPGLGKSPWESPVGEVTSGMNVVESFKSYGDISAFNKKGPNTNKIRNRGSEYVASEFPEMDYFKRCSIAVPASAKVKTAMVASMESASSGSVFDGGLLLVNVLIMVISGIAVLVILSRICFGKRGRRKAARGESNATPLQ